jgi:hypothetical protein
VYRSAVTGRFVTRAYAATHPGETVHEHHGRVAALKARIAALADRLSGREGRS